VPVLRAANLAVDLLQPLLDPRIART
jgi:ABC-type dipeptide/oligopeptide/nickel transport system permease component